MTYGQRSTAVQEIRSYGVSRARKPSCPSLLLLATALFRWFLWDSRPPGPGMERARPCEIRMLPLISGGRWPPTASRNWSSSGVSAWRRRRLRTNDRWLCCCSPKHTRSKFGAGSDDQLIQIQVFPAVRRKSRQYPFPRRSPLAETAQQNGKLPRSLRGPYYYY